MKRRFAWEALCAAIALSLVAGCIDTSMYHVMDEEIPGQAATNTCLTAEK